MECNICYDKTYNLVYCFHKCKFIVCRNCFKKMLTMVEDDLFYCCPMCRRDNVYGINKNFTLFINKGMDLLRIGLGLYKEAYKQQALSHHWTLYSLSHIDNIRAPTIL